jgi:stage V sporulation protein B
MDIYSQLKDNSKGFVATKAGIFSFIDFFLGALLGWLLQMFLSRSLGPHGYGQLAIINTIFLTFAGIFTPGLSLAVTRHAAVHSSPRTVFIHAIRIEIIVDILVYLLYFLLIDVICKFLSVSELKPYMIILGIMIMPKGLVLVSLGYFNGIINFAKSLKISLSYNISRIVFCILFFNLKLGLLGIVIGFALAEIVSLIFSVIIARVADYVPLLPFHNIYRDLLYISFPLWLIGFLNFFVKRIDIICIRYFLSDYNSVGYYEAAFRVTEMIVAFLSISYASLLPILSSALAKKDNALAQLALERSVRYCFLLALPLCILISINSRFIMSLIFSYRFASGAMVLSILSLGWIFLSILYVLNFVVLAQGEVWKIVKFIPLFLLVSVLLNIIFIPMWGINGAAVASVISLLFAKGLVFFVSYTNNLLPIKKIAWLNRRTFLNGIIAMAISVLVVSVIKNNNELINLLIKSISFIFFYFFALKFLLREINKEDMNIVRALSNKIKFIFAKKQ